MDKERNIIMKKVRFVLALTTVLAMAGFGMTGCSGSTSSSSDAAGSSVGSSSADTSVGESSASDSSSVAESTGETRTIKVAYTQGNAPSEFTNDAGEPDGYDIKALMAVDELLTEYTFEYVPTTMDDLVTGITEGVYQIGVSGSFKTTEREEKMLFPNEPLGASVISITLRKEDAECDTIRKAVEKGLKMSPISSSDGMFCIVEDYNEANPDAPIEMSTTSATTLADFYIYIAEGRYDYMLFPTSVWDALIGGEGAELSYLQDQLVNYNITAVPTWTLLNKGETDLAEAIDGALKSLKDDGTLSKLQNEYFGMDQFTYLDD